MTKFLGIYRGAACYEVETQDTGKSSSKVIAKAAHPESKDQGIQFAEKAPTQEKALTRLKQSIDEYLTKNSLDRFTIELF